MQPITCNKKFIFIVLSLYAFGRLFLTLAILPTSFCLQSLNPHRNDVFKVFCVNYRSLPCNTGIKYRKYLSFCCIHCNVQYCCSFQGEGVLTILLELFLLPLKLTILPYSVAASGRKHCRVSGKFTVEIQEHSVDHFYSK
jgi:hypothetical protein